ncbi:haloacid dehalogenase type II [Phaeodactylibacter luteus]|uniref:Haloacid dehalogenase type II n=1 Tax=Phaeodactylibacter luteus TaxID=1564516 RepID=A0A5C6RHK0_9BACT|nr:haloacid dehalogenase type II [Phaeodactylibacter luteus]TXB61494.1 haloacid dehalogenase type II [Phaeodactylibacter luteus]
MSNATKPAIKALVFDAYGTLFDVNSINQTLQELLPQQAQEVAAIWRRKQLEYTWLRTLMGQYRDFYALTEEALAFALHQCGASLEEPQQRQLMGAYYRLKVFPDVPEALSTLAQSHTLAVLSNANPSLLERATAWNGIDEHFSALISADEIQHYKPVPAVYALAEARLGLPAKEMLFVSSNTWDVAGAAAAGLQTAWLNRNDSAGQLEQLGYPPLAAFPSLAALRTWLMA